MEQDPVESYRAAAEERLQERLRRMNTLYRRRQLGLLIQEIALMIVLILAFVFLYATYKDYGFLIVGGALLVLFVAVLIRQRKHLVPKYRK